MNFNPEIHKIKTPKTARIFLSGPVSPSTKQVWIILHGYAQHAGFFLQKFQPLFSKEIVFVAPEGLNRFYVKGSSGHVGASWMTKEERLDEIDDYIHYLETAVQSLKLNPKTELNVLGFSQGGSTLARWIAFSSFKPKRVIFYAGVFPPDLELNFKQEQWKSPEITVMLGNQDQYYTMENFRQTFQLLEQINPDVKYISFEGGHEIIPDLLRIFTK